MLTSTKTYDVASGTCPFAGGAVGKWSLSSCPAALPMVPVPGFAVGLAGGLARSWPS